MVALNLSAVSGLSISFNKQLPLMLGRPFFYGSDPWLAAHNVRCLPGRRGRPPHCRLQNLNLVNSMGVNPLSSMSSAQQDNTYGTYLVLELLLLLLPCPTLVVLC